ncbi:olfactory receptor 10A3-like [Gastrophryne carolinensis]
MALTSNVLVVVLIGVNQSLHSPMYFFLSQLSLSEILFTSNIVPTILWLILKGSGKVSIARCFSQFYLLAVATIAQCLLLAAMSFDRHVAICKPLHYTVVMTFGLQLKIVTSCWLMGVSLALVLYILLNRLEFCGPYKINHFYCDIDPVLQLSCSDTFFPKLVASMLSTPLVVCPFMFIMATYISIFHAILKLSSTMRRQKAFSTCSSHLAVVGLYFGSLASIYIFPQGSSIIDTSKNLSLLYILVTPLFNPLIYSLRNQDIRGAIIKWAYILASRLSSPNPLERQ